MSEPFVFDSRSTECKEPFGAVPCGQFVTFCCRPLLKEDFTHCSVLFFHEFSGPDPGGGNGLPGSGGRPPLLFRRRRRPAGAGAELVSFPPVAGRRHRLFSG